MINYKLLPKVELHLHLDTSMRIETIRKFLIREKIDVPEPLEQFCVAPDKCENLMDYLDRIVPALNALQSTDAIEETAYQLVESLGEFNHLYTEIRFAPQLHLEKGESTQSILNAALRGFKRGTKDFKTEIGVIICALRHLSKEENMDIADLAIRNRENIAGFDLAANEEISGNHQKIVFEKIKAAGIPITVHAGEAMGPERIDEAISVLNARRIGHGVRLEENSELKKKIIDLQIPLEMCPTSNVQTNSTASYSTHPADRYLKENICVTINTDSNTITPSNLTSEYEILGKTFGWGIEEFRKTQINAIDHSFLEKDKKAELKRKFIELMIGK